ncbi:MAG: calcium-binding protein [Asticcacaulis sp.]|nr:calcium-binding protein [Asticcacaulis sp.]
MNKAALAGGLLHVDGAGGTDGLEMNLAILGAEIQNVVWTITGDVTASSNIGIYDHFETINMTLGGGNNVLNMGNEVDTIYSEAGHDVINAGGGDDTLQAHFYNHTALSVTYHGGTGNDTLSGGAVDDYLYGDADDDYIDGGAGNDAINGGAGADVLIGGLGTDTLLGGTGNDIYYLDDFHDVVTESKGQGTDTVYSSVQYIMGGSYVENAILTGSLNSYAVGNALDNQLTGNSGNNNLTGGAGNDHLDGGAGADGLRGGLGNDTYYVDNLGDFIVESKDEGTDLVFSSVNFNLGAQYIENLTLTGTASINGSGNALINTITGNAGNNILDGRQGADIMSGGAGNDIYYVDNLCDKVIEANGKGTDMVISSVTFAMGGQYIDNLTLTGTGKINGSGNALTNTIIGNSNVNTLNGGAGNDTLTGGAGADIFFFGAGSGKDTITDFSAVQGDKLNLDAYNQATAVITQVGNNTVIDLGGGNIITLTGVHKADVTSHITW